MLQQRAPLLLRSVRHYFGRSSASDLSAGSVCTLNVSSSNTNNNNNNDARYFSGVGSVNNGLLRLSNEQAQHQKNKNGAYQVFMSSDSSQDNHMLNIGKGLKKEKERCHFHEMIDEPVSILQGIGPKHEAALHVLGIKTVAQLADFKFHHLAQSIVTLAALEETRLEGTGMNLDLGLDKAAETMAFAELVSQPVDVLQGIAEVKAQALASLAIHTVEDLAAYKYCHWAQAIVTASKFEMKEIDSAGDEEKVSEATATKK